MSTETLPLSAFIQRQTSVYPILDRADVILERRGETNLVLMSNERYDALMDGLRFAARSLRIMARANRNLAEEALAEELPWLAWLPKDGAAQAVGELLTHLIAGADTGLFTPFARSLAEWRSTAEIYNDPALTARLNGPLSSAEAIELSSPPSDTMDVVVSAAAVRDEDVVTELAAIMRELPSGQRSRIIHELLSTLREKNA